MATKLNKIRAVLADEDWLRCANCKEEFLLGELKPYMNIITGSVVPCCPECGLAAGLRFANKKQHVSDTRRIRELYNSLSLNE